MRHALLVLLLLLSAALPALAQNSVGAATGDGTDVATTSTRVLTANSDRKGSHVCNASDTRVWCQWTSAAIVNKGFFLDAGLCATYDSTLNPVGELYCLHASTGTKRVTTEEFE